MYLAEEEPHDLDPFYISDESNLNIKNEEKINMRNDNEQLKYADYS